MTREDRGAGGQGGPPPAPVSLADRYCDTVDRVNSWVGRFWALAIFGVTLAVLYEVVSRTALYDSVIIPVLATIPAAAKVIIRAVPP